MSEEKRVNEDIKPEPHWEKAKPGKLPEPTYWPFFLAMGLVFMFWGMLTTLVIFFAGVFIFLFSLLRWINILRHEE